MTTLYRSVLIETAEQAEALPRGTVAVSGRGFARLVGIRVGKPGEATNGWLVMSEVLGHDFMTGWEALVPIEAEEETTWPSRAPGPAHVGFGATFDAPHTRLVTPWEEA